MSSRRATPATCSTSWTQGSGMAKRNSVPLPKAVQWAWASMRAPRASQKHVRVRSATTLVAPGLQAAASRSPTWSALARSISSGSVTITDWSSALASGRMWSTKKTTPEGLHAATRRSRRAGASPDNGWLDNRACYCAHTCPLRSTLGGREDRVKVTIRPYGQPDAADLADVVADEGDRVGYSALRSGHIDHALCFSQLRDTKGFAGPRARRLGARAHHQNAW
jgi:hypothetical protein